MIERDIQYFNDPFKYVVIDDFFSKEDLEFVTNTLNTIQEKKDFDNIFDTQKARKRKLAKDLHDYNKDPNQRFAKYFELADSLDIKQDKEKIFTSQYVYSFRVIFQNEKLFYESSRDYSFRVKKLVEDYPIHPEHIKKGISLLVYLSEEENYGTELYDEDKNFVKQIEWKNNRAFIMSGFDNQNGTLQGTSTWHTYRTKPGSIRRTFFGQTVCTKESVLNHSLYEDYYVKGYGNNHIKKINK